MVFPARSRGAFGLGGRDTVMTATLGNVTRKKEKPEPAAEQRATEERCAKRRCAKSQGKPSALAG